MLVIRFIKVQPTTYLLQYRHGQIVREGVGLSFFYYGPVTSLVAVPIATTDTPFIFEEPTADYQTVTIQGQVTFRVADAKKLAAYHLPITAVRDAIVEQKWSDDKKALKLIFVCGNEPASQDPVVKLKGTVQ